ncbi:hypothetical protein O9992_23305 [Vibrio lentus]|nr:hypothetical protein [Vibrio lentus]
MLDVLGTTLIAELATKLFCSQRTLERSFNKVAVINVKTMPVDEQTRGDARIPYKRNFDDIGIETLPTSLI